MSFLEPRSAIVNCNMALSRIKQQPLSGTLDDPGNLAKHAGRECNLWYKKIVRQVLMMHHWGLATKRVALAGAPANDRSTEWTQAYLAPSDMAFPVSISPFLGSSSVISYYRGMGFLMARLMGRPIFLYSRKTIYSLVNGAVLDYVSFDITEQDFNDAVEKLVVLFLASVLARSIAKDDQLARELHDEGLKEANLEIARELNLGGQRYGEGPTEAELARGNPTLTTLIAAMGGVAVSGEGIDDPGDLSGLIP